MTASKPILAGSTERISPMSRALNLVKERPPRVEIKIPRATAVEENTPITVSLARAERRRTQLKSRANTTAKSTAAQVGSLKPQMAPIAIPVKAEWPRASEKKDMRLCTTIVERIPKSGEMTSTASRAFFIKYIPPLWAQSKGSSSTREYQSSINSPLPSPPAGGTSHKTLGRRGFPPEAQI